MTELYKLVGDRGWAKPVEDVELTWTADLRANTLEKGTHLCASPVFHAHEHPLIAVLMNPIQARLNPATMRLFVAEGEIVARDGQLKCGVFSLEIIEEIPVPVLTDEQRVMCAIMCAKEVGVASRVWLDWADNWLKGVDRSSEAAESVINFLNSAPKNAYLEDARHATWAAHHSYSSLRDLSSQSAAKSIQMAVQALNSLDVVALLAQTSRLDDHTQQ